mgnify:CR=1 FL=1
MSTLLLVDGNSIINRAYYAVIGRAPMTSPDGTPTGAVNGFFNSVLGVMKEYDPDLEDPENRYLKEFCKVFPIYIYDPLEAFLQPASIILY